MPGSATLQQRRRVLMAVALALRRHPTAAAAPAARLLYPAAAPVDQIRLNGQAAEARVPFHRVDHPQRSAERTVHEHFAAAHLVAGAQGQDGTGRP